MNTKEGFIVVNRSLFNNALWEDKPFARGQAWIDLIRMASYKDKEFMHGAKIVPLKRGEFITSELKLAEKWGWSRNKVRTFLSTLTSTGNITKVGTREYTIITIENYDIYQLKQSTEGTTKRTTKGTTKGQQKDNERYTINKVNKRNKEKERKEETTNPFLYI